MQFKSIRTKSLVVLIPLFLLSFIILASVTYYFANKNLMQSSQEIAAEMGKKFSWQVKYEVDQKMHVLGELAGNPIFKGNDNAAKIQALSEAQKRNNFPSMMILDLQGNGFGTNGKPLKRGDREYVKKVLETKKPYVPKPVLSAVTKTLTVVLTTPIYDNGNMIGMITGTIDLGELSNTMSEVKFRDSSYGYIVGDSGLVLAHPKNPELINKLNVFSRENNSDLKIEGSLDEKLIAGFKSVFETGKQTAVRYSNFDGKQHEAVITPIELSGKRWAMVVTTPVSEIEANAVQLANIMALISIIFIVLAIVLIFFFAKRIARDLSIIRDECKDLNAGNLSDRPKYIVSQDEIGDLADGFQQMRKTLNGLIRQVQDKAESVAAASEQLTAGADQSAQAANQIAASITTIADGVCDQSKSAETVTVTAKTISVHAENIADKAKEIVHITNTTTKNASIGRDNIAQAVAQMQKIGDGSSEVELAINELSKGANEIGDIVNLISNIAGQTNLLALNAAIEAARAGEAGRGFAVVADEIRKLAEESNRSSQRIADLVVKNKIDMERAVAASKFGAAGVVKGIDAVQSADETFKNILSSIEGLAVEISSISDAIDEMSSGSQQMVNLLTSIDDISKKNSAETQSVSAATEEQSATMFEVASASKNLSSLANELQITVEKFKLQ